MFRQIRFAAALAVLTGMSLGGTVFLLNALNAEQRRNDTFHAATAQDLLEGARARARLGALLDRVEAENRDSIRDRRRIAEQLGRIEGAPAR